MPLLKLSHVPRYGELLRLLVAHREALRAASATGASGGAAGGGGEDEADAAELVRTLEAMGPTYVKLGQVLASRVDLLPPAYTSALGRLQDRGEALPFADVRRVVEEELGGRLSSVFAQFEERPLGAASLAQVHRARLHDGARVAVKVQRPDVRARILEDMDVVTEVASAFDAHVGAAERAGLGAMVDQFRRALLRELDYRQEAANLRLLAGMLEPYDRLFTPAPYDDRSTARVLTMTLLDGRDLTTVTPDAVAPEVGAELVGQLFKAYLDQVLVHGVFHADPHPGNLLLVDGARLGVVDVGMTAFVATDLKDSLLRLLVALGEGEGAAAAQALERAGEPLEDFDRDQLGREVSALVVATRGATMGELQVGRQLGQLARVAVACGLRPAPELAMIGKVMLHLDDAARHLAPTYEPTDAIREHVVSLTRHRFLESASPSHLVSAALDAKELAEQLPHRVNKVLDSLAEGQFRFSVQGLDESDIMRSVQKLANRGAAGLAVVAFVIAAAIFSLAPGGPRLWGVSAFTVAFLAAAFVLGASIMADTLLHDLPQHRGRRHRAARRRSR